MEELENKLYSSNSLNMSMLMSKIVNSVKRKHEDGIKDYPEVKYLKEKVMSNDPLISEVAGLSLMYLIKDGILSVDPILTDLISTMNSAKCYPNLINILGDLLCIQTKTKYNVINPQHPFISLIKENPELSVDILNKINSLTEVNTADVHKIFQPFYLYSLCCPSKNTLYLLKYKLWKNLLETKCLNVICTGFYKNILGWLQVEARSDLQIVSDQLLEALYVSFSSESFLNPEILILWQINILCNLTRHKLDVRPTISSLQSALEKRKLVTVDSALLMLSGLIDICSPLYLDDLFLLCKTLIEQNDVNLYSLQTVNASILQWLASPCTLINNAYETAKDLVNIISSKVTFYKEEKSLILKNIIEEYKYQISTSKNIFLSVYISVNLEKFTEEKFIKNWLNDIKIVPMEFQLDLFNLLCGILMVDHHDCSISIDVLNILVNCIIERDFSLSSKLLALILYKLSNNNHPEFAFALVKALPKMAGLRDNIPKIMATIQAISKHSENLFNVVLSVAYEIWEIDNKCYTYLEDFLINDPPSKKKWERYILKADIVKKLCEKKPELYGKDLIATLSTILNECDDENGALPCSIAIEAIIVLCRAGVIDIKTTWTNLSTKFNDDLRLPVVKSLCTLIQEIPHLSYSESYIDLFSDTTEKLWQYVEFGDPQISEVAFQSLASFGLEHICENLPKKYEESTSTNQINSITGKTWIHFLIENGSSTASVNFIKRMISNEIGGYLKYVYQQKGPKEPIDYGYLPSHSVVRAIGKFIKTWANKWKGSIHDKLYLECLKIFSYQYSKPLPPLDWCFLQELMHDLKTKENSIDIASHQVVLSGTARRLIENYIVAATEKPQDDDIKIIFKNLKFLAKSIQPVILKPFFECSIWYAIKKYNQNEHQLLNNISTNIQDVFKLEEVQETNKITILQVLDSIIFVTNLNQELFNILCQIITTAPAECLKQISNVKVTNNEENFLKSSKIRFALAKNTKMTPLLWLDDVIEIWSTNFRDINLWNDFGEVLKSHMCNPEEGIPYVLELIGQIQARIADRYDTLVITFMFDILIFVVNIFSGYFIFLNEEVYDGTKLMNFFPQSLASLLDRSGWNMNSVQMLEWLYHMNTEENVPKKYRSIFGICLQGLKHNDEFSKNQRWLKYLNSSIIFE